MSKERQRQLTVGAMSDAARGLSDGQWANTTKALMRQNVLRGDTQSPNWSEGARSAEAYWSIWLSRTLPVETLADLLAVHGDAPPVLDVHAKDLAKLKPPTAADAYRERRVAILLALKLAHETMKLTFFGATTASPQRRAPAGPPLSMVTRENFGRGIAGLSTVTVGALAAVEWLLSAPDYRDLVPRELAQLPPRLPRKEIPPSHAAADLTADQAARLMATGVKVMSSTKKAAAARSAKAVVRPALRRAACELLLARSGAISQAECVRQIGGDHDDRVVRDAIADLFVRGKGRGKMPRLDWRDVCEADLPPVDPDRPAAPPPAT